MKKQLSNFSKLPSIAVAFFFASALLFSAKTVNAQRCGISGVGFTQQAGFGNNSQIVIGGYGQNDGSICFNCYSDSTHYGRSHVFNRNTSGIIPPLGSPVPDFSSRIFQDIPAGILRIQSSPDNNNCYDSVAWTKGMSLLQDGSVGIGTDQTFGYQLAVNGKIIARHEVRSTLTGVAWPDYVFTDTFALKPLQSLELEIDSLGHLPEIPSAAEVEAEGLSLTGISVQLVKKVEELTLYMIEQNKQIEELKRQNAELKKMVVSTNPKENK